MRAKKQRLTLAGCTADGELESDTLRLTEEREAILQKEVGCVAAEETARFTDEVEADSIAQSDSKDTKASGVAEEQAKVARLEEEAEVCRQKERENDTKRHMQPQHQAAPFQRHTTHKQQRNKRRITKRLRIIKANKTRRTQAEDKMRGLGEPTRRQSHQTTTSSHSLFPQHTELVALEPTEQHTACHNQHADDGRNNATEHDDHSHHSSKDHRERPGRTRQPLQAQASP